MKGWTKIMDAIRDEHELLGEIADSEQGLSLQAILDFRVKLLEQRRETNKSWSKKAAVVGTVCADYDNYWTERVADETGFFFSVYQLPSNV